MRPLTVGSIVAASCAIAAIACFSERGAGPPVNPAAQCSVPVTVIDSMHYIVAIRDFGFHPGSLSVPVGATVTWVNCEPFGVEPHTTTSDVAVWESPDISVGNRFSQTFPAPGTFPYHCTPHPYMVGEVIVQ